MYLLTCTCRAAPRPIAMRASRRETISGPYFGFWITATFVPGIKPSETILRNASFPAVSTTTSPVSPAERVLKGQGSSEGVRSMTAGLSSIFSLLGIYHTIFYLQIICKYSRKKKR